MGVYNTDQLKKLILAAQEGDSLAFGHIFENLYRPLYAYIYLRVRDKEVAKDITQDVFLKVYGSLSKIQIMETSPLSYFYTVAHNTIIDFRRKKKALTFDDATLTVLADDRGESLEENHTQVQMDIEQVRAAIETLPEEQQRAILLRFIDEKSYAEIAEMLGKSEVTVRQVVSRGIKSLRNTLNLH